MGGPRSSCPPLADPRTRLPACSACEWRHAPNDARPFQRGINSIQLVHDGRRWWVASLLWRAEGDKSPLPQRCLKSR
ncbi:hypothetical protein [Massilia sp. TWR1-2-2]|uniref:hypothetical protein n=1 Tax=Massilia sp. TWR1-2-2 TaxID=2804584 RepID=UPI003CEE55AB